MESITPFYGYVVKGNIDLSSTNKIYIMSIFRDYLFSKIKATTRRKKEQ